MWTTVNWLILAASAVLMVYIGLRSSRVCKDSDEAGFLVAGGNLGMFVVTCTIVATGYSGWCFMGAPGVVLPVRGHRAAGQLHVRPGHRLRESSSSPAPCASGPARCKA